MEIFNNFWGLVNVFSCASLIELTDYNRITQLLKCNIIWTIRCISKNCFYPLGM